MNYLIYIEHAAENLQFFLWYRDYAERFAVLPSREKALAPEWTISQAEAEMLAAQTHGGGQKKLSPETAAIFKGTDFAPGAKVTVSEYAGNPFNTPPMTPTTEAASIFSSTPSDGKSTLVGSNDPHVTKAAGAFENADLKWQPCKLVYRCFHRCD